MGYVTAVAFASFALYLLFDIRNNLRQLQRRLNAIDPLLANLQTQIAEAALEAAEARKLSEQVLHSTQTKRDL